MNHPVGHTLRPINHNNTQHFKVNQRAEQHNLLYKTIKYFNCFFVQAVRHLEYELCYSGPPTKSTMRFDYPVKVWYRSDICRRRYYNFIILPFWLENA